MYDTMSAHLCAYIICRYHYGDGTTSNNTYA